MKNKRFNWDENAKNKLIGLIRSNVTPSEAYKIMGCTFSQCNNMIYFLRKNGHGLPKHDYRIATLKPKNIDVGYYPECKDSGYYY